ncbi:MAG: hypothetical protein ACOCXT_02430 [Candidatus Dojkabacteria bacterium]
MYSHLSPSQSSNSPNAPRMFLFYTISASDTKKRWIHKAHAHGKLVLEEERIIMHIFKNSSEHIFSLDEHVIQLQNKQGLLLDQNLPSQGVFDSQFTPYLSVGSHSRMFTVALVDEHLHRRDRKTYTFSSAKTYGVLLLHLQKLQGKKDKLGGYLHVLQKDEKDIFRDLLVPNMVTFILAILTLLVSLLTLSISPEFARIPVVLFFIAIVALGAIYLIGYVRATNYRKQVKQILREEV